MASSVRVDDVLNPRDVVRDVSVDGGKASVGSHAQRHRPAGQPHHRPRPGALTLTHQGRAAISLTTETIFALLSLTLTARGSILDIRI